MQHPNVIRLFGLAISPPELYVVMEYASKGSLFHILSTLERAQREGRGTGQLEPLQQLSLARDTVRGLSRLHSHSPVVLHCDLKSLNLLVDDNWCLKLCDFGESSFDFDGSASTGRGSASKAKFGTGGRRYRPGGKFSSRSTSADGVASSAPSRFQSGEFLRDRPIAEPVPKPKPKPKPKPRVRNPRVTPHWAAPEVLAGERFSQEADVYSMGMCMFEIFTGVQPFTEIMDPKEVRQMVQDGKRPTAVLERARLPAVGRRLIERSWAAMPEQRPRLEEWLEAVEGGAFAEIGSWAVGCGGAGRGGSTAGHRQAVAAAPVVDAGAGDAGAPGPDDAPPLDDERQYRSLS